MSECTTNGGCACTPNRAIHCTVSACSNHCRDSQYCGLASIEVGERGAEHGTDCRSFRKG